MSNSIKLDELLPYLHCFAVLSNDHQIECCDPHFAGLLGYSTNELIGSSYRYIIPLQESLAFNQLLNSESQSEGEITLISKDRRELSFDYNFSKFGPQKLIVIKPKLDSPLLSSQEYLLSEFNKVIPEATALFGFESELKLATGGWWKFFDQQSEIEDSHFDDYFTGSQARWKRLISHALSGKIEQCNEDHVQISSGKKVWMGWTLSPWVEQGEVSGFLISIDDIHERKVVEAEAKAAKVLAEAAVEQKMSFMSRMSHEIRTPLNCLSAMTESLEDTPLNQDQEKYVGLFKSSLDHLLNLINDILDLRKIQETDTIFNVQFFSLKKVLIETVEPFQSSAKNKALELEWDYQGIPSLEVEGDSYRFKQIIINLVGNALKFTEAGKIRVEVTAEQVKNQCVAQLRVIDSGIGMTQEQQVRVFDSFAQADSTISEKYGGTGLGLSIVKSLVEKMKGKIKVQSQVGVGTTFEIRLPFSRSQIANPRTVQKRSSKEDIEIFDQKILAPENFPPAKILVVDDSEMNRMAISALLKSYAIEIIEAESGLEALNLIKKERFDVVFLDIQMPGMDGFETVNHIRHLDDTLKRKQWVVALTANAFKEDVQKSLDAGFNAHLSKPIKRKRLLRTILQNLSPKVEGKLTNG